MRQFFASLVLISTLSSGASAQSVTDGPGAELRVLDKLTGAVIDMSLRTGETGKLGYLLVTLNACRYPADNPSGNAYAELLVRYRDDDNPVFAGWMLAAAPALSAMDHPRYDVWPLRCMTS